MGNAASRRAEQVDWRVDCAAELCCHAEQYLLRIEI